MGNVLAFEAFVSMIAGRTSSFSGLNGNRAWQMADIAVAAAVGVCVWGGVAALPDADSFNDDVRLESLSTARGALRDRAREIRRPAHGCFARTCHGTCSPSREFEPNVC
jgi:hypothetical protein